LAARLVPASLTLGELRGVIQVAIGWAGIHLYRFRLRSVRYGSPELSAASPDVTLAARQFRTNARFVYAYDLNVYWRHELRIEERLEANAIPLPRSDDRRHHAARLARAAERL
jgi:hypothetical protein